MSAEEYAETICGGKLSRRSISAKEEELTWDISTCIHESYERKITLRSPEFSFDRATCVLFASLHRCSIRFGIFCQPSNSSIGVCDCFCNLSYKKLESEVLKRFELKFEWDEAMPVIGMKSSFSLQNIVDTKRRKFHWEDAIVFRYRIKNSRDITNSSVERARKFRGIMPIFCAEDWKYGGELTSQLISTEEEELRWNISSFVHDQSTVGSKCPDFSFAGGTWYLVARFDQRNSVDFGIDIRERCTSDEVFDCCCNISCQNFEGKIFQRFEMKFRCDKAMPLISMRDYHQFPQSISSRISIRKEGLVIVCRISSKKLNITEACSSGESICSGGGSVIEVREPAHWPEQNHDGGPIVNTIYKCFKDFRQLYLSSIYSDVILNVGSQSFKAHRLILSARSSVFASMFRHNMKEKTTGVVNIEDCDASSFPVLLEFLYCGSTAKISLENVFALYISSDKYDLQDLKEKCREFIKNNLSVETFCDAVNLSLRHLDNELLKLTIDFFARNFKKIILTVKWQDFILENPIQANEIFINALASSSQDD